MFSLALYLTALAVLVLSYRRDRARTARALVIAWRSFTGLLPSMLGILGLVGLLLAVVPNTVLTGLFGGHSAGGTLLAALVGSVTMMPAFVGFPLGASLLEAGAAVDKVACFLTTLLMVGVVTAPLEISYFGPRFTYWRNALGFVFALLIGLAMGRILA